MATKHLSCLSIIVCMFICVLGIQTTWAVEEPNDIVSACFSASGFLESTEACPSWITVLDRYSTDPTGADYGIIAKVDSCQIYAYDVNSIPQGTPTPIAIDMQKDDIFIVWDEDDGHGSNIDFTYTDNAYIANPDAADPNTGYVWVTSHDENRINWVVYQVTKDGTLTINNTGLNEHDVIHLFRNQIDFEKVDDVNDLECRSPEAEIEYTICWDNNGVYTFDDCFIIDYLPDGVDYNPLISISPPIIDDNYNSEEHYYIWEIGDIAPGDANCVTLEVTVNYKAEPGMYLHNVAELWSGDSLIARATEDTLVCCWGDPNIIYVDITADGYDSGVSWENAYSGIDGVQKALARARNSICEGPYTIYVAQGSYSPGENDWDSFQLPEGISVYGGFQTGGCDFVDRNPDQYQTILTGAIDPNTHNDTIVIMSDDTELDQTTLLDGFIVTDAAENGIYGYGVDFKIENCQVNNHVENGVYAENGNVNIEWCLIENNGEHGIYHTGENKTLTLQNSKIFKCLKNGVYCQNSTPLIFNSVVFKNGFSENGFHGIYILLPSNTPTLYNNTIICNKKTGVSYFDSDPNYLQNPDYIDLQNCILWYNNDGADQVIGLNPDNTAYYCCIQDCNDVTGRYNIDDEPMFAYTTEPNNIPDPNNPYHLSWTSPCKDAGNPLFDNDDAGLYDMDAEDRISYGRIDIGADEVYSCNGNNNDDIYNALDLNSDGIVNLVEFSPFSEAWLSRDPNEYSDPNFIDPNEIENWNSWCNLDDTGTSQYVIDLDDIDVFLDDWLWIACWKYSQMHRFDNMMAAMMSGGGESMAMMSESLFAESISFESAAFEPVEEVDPYAEMSVSEVVSLVVGIHDIINILEISIEEDHENAENLYEAKEFLEDVLSDIAVSRE